MLSGMWLNQWLLSEWIWHATLAWYQPIITGILMYILLRLVMRLSIMFSLGLPFFSLLFTALIFTLYATIILAGWLDVSTSYTTDPLNACLYLALIYSIGQSLFLWALSYWYPIALRPVIIVTIISNLLGALLMYKFLPLL